MDKFLLCYWKEINSFAHFVERIVTAPSIGQTVLIMTGQTAPYLYLGQIDLASCGRYNHLTNCWLDQVPGCLDRATYSRRSDQVPGWLDRATYSRSDQHPGAFS